MSEKLIDLISGLRSELNYVYRQLALKKNALPEITANGSDNVIRCQTETVGAEAGDVCKVVEGSEIGGTYYPLAKPFDGSETTDDDFKTGIVLLGNSDNVDLKVYVLIGGVANVIKDSSSSSVVEGQKLYMPSTGGVKVTTDTTSELPLLESLSSADAGKREITVTFLSGGEGGGEGLVERGALCKVTSRIGTGIYAVDIYLDGRNEPATGSGTLQVLELNVLNDLDPGTWVVGTPVNVPVLNDEAI